MTRSPPKSTLSRGEDDPFGIEPEAPPEGPKEYQFAFEFYDKIIPSTASHEWAPEFWTISFSKNTLQLKDWPRLTTEGTDTSLIVHDDFMVSLESTFCVQRLSRIWLLTGR